MFVSTKSFLVFTEVSLDSQYVNKCTWYNVLYFSTSLQAYYLHQEGYEFTHIGLAVCMFASWITQELVEEIFMKYGT